MSAMAAILVGDVRERLRELPDGSVHASVTSPPYLDQRNYRIDGQIGYGQSPQEYVSDLIAVYREVRRVLRKDGIAFLNIADSYVKSGARQKDLMLLPEQIAIALQQDGWFIRSRISWVKGNPMPESAKDRPSSAWEFVYMLTRGQDCFWDAEAVREQTTAFAGHNMRNAWQINVQPYPGAHLATFPPELPRRCILAATSEHGCCPQCGAPFRRVLEKGEPDIVHQRACGGDVAGEYAGQATKDYATAGAQNASDVKRRILAGMRKRRTIGWVPSCHCEPSRAVPALVLDCFGGSGTTSAVAASLGRDSVYVDLSPEYAAMAAERIGTFAHVTDFFWGNP